MTNGLRHLCANIDDGELTAPIPYDRLVLARPIRLLAGPAELRVLNLSWSCGVLVRTGSNKCVESHLYLGIWLRQKLSEPSENPTVKAANLKLRCSQQCCTTKRKTRNCGDAGNQCGIAIRAGRKASHLWITFDRTSGCASHDVVFLCKK